MVQPAHKGQQGETLSTVRAQEGVASSKRRTDSALPTETVLSHRFSASPGVGSEIQGSLLQFFVFIVIEYSDIAKWSRKLLVS